jgi:DNA mismatch repair protein PMS2
VQFGVDDIHELASLLAENPGHMVRLPKVRPMFASRACRMSIMIGRALKRAQMVKVIRNLGKIEQPWAW